MKDVRKNLKITMKDPVYILTNKKILFSIFTKQKLLLIIYCMFIISLLQNKKDTNKTLNSIITHNTTVSVTHPLTTR